MYIGGRENSSLDDRRRRLTDRNEQHFETSVRKKEKVREREREETQRRQRDSKREINKKPV